MKNTINYYYNLVTYDIHQIDKTYSFVINNEPYVFMPYDRLANDINNIYEISTNLFRQNIYCHQIVPNNRRELITNVNGEPYVLLKIYINYHDKINIKNVLSFNYLIMRDQYQALRRDDWYSLWSRKIDYYEEQVREFGKKFPLIRESFSYFVGVVETGIILLQNSNSKDSQLVVSHQRINGDTTFFELYNPLNFIIDSKARNISEYLKDLFINDKITIEDIKKYLSYSNFNSNELYLFFARLFYPTFYFDIYRDIIIEGRNEEDIKFAINKIPKYERLLKEIYIYLKNYISLPDVEWIIKI